MTMTTKEADTLAFCLATALRGHALHVALARHRGVKVSTAEAAVNRLVVKGYLTPGGTPTEIVKILEEVSLFLARRTWSMDELPTIMAFRERIAEFLKSA